MMTGKQMQQIILQHTCPLEQIIEDWVRDKESIAESELIKTEDLFYCLHNAVRSAQLGKPTVPSTFDPIGRMVIQISSLKKARILSSFGYPHVLEDRKSVV